MTHGDEDHVAPLGEDAELPADHFVDHDGSAASGVEHGLPGLQDEDRLPWLDSVDDEYDDAGVDAKRVWGFVLAGLALLALIVGGVYWITRHGQAGTQLADGSTVAAPPGPIKEAPANPGGKTFEGTGDSSFAVSQGRNPGARLASGSDQAAAPDDGSAAPKGPASKGAAANGGASASGGAGGVGIQIGAFSTQAAAETAWSHLSQTYDALSGTQHRIVEGKADIGTVYRLQAVAGSDDAAGALCDKLKAAGLNCQVKD